MAMDTENIKKYYPLGSKTLFMFVLKKSSALILLLPIFFVGIFFLSYVPHNYIDIAINILFGYVVFLIIIFAAVFFLAWLQYFRYQIFVDDKDLKVQRGLISVEEIGVPYRRIKDLRIERSLLDQIVGVSDLIITVLGSEDNEFSENKATIILPSVSKEVGLEIQDIVLKKVQVEQINVVSGHKVVKYE